jgi:hypothetical protein
LLIGLRAKSWAATGTNNTYGYPLHTEEMEKALEKEGNRRLLGSLPETAPVVIGEYLTKRKDESKVETRSYLGRARVESQTVK